tara:strand:+ start:130 stop:594 length:465 start_codon:yes stop_codon:yes gene_type:complete
MRNEEVELKHIQLELNNERSQHLRHFVDQYFCYKNGYVNKNGKPKWDLIFWKEWVSEEAEKVSHKDLVVKEHIVPLKVITDKLKELDSNCTIEQIKSIIDEFLHFATITKEEDKRLSSLGFKQKMPNEFYEENHNMFGDIFARYKVAEIKCIKA